MYKNDFLPSLQIICNTLQLKPQNIRRIGVGKKVYNWQLYQQGACTITSTIKKKKFKFKWKWKDWQQQQNYSTFSDNIFFVSSLFISFYQQFFFSFLFFFFLILIWIMVLMMTVLSFLSMYFYDLLINVKKGKQNWKLKIKKKREWKYFNSDCQ